MIKPGDHVHVTDYSVPETHTFVADRSYEYIEDFYDAMNKKHELFLKDSQCSYLVSGNPIPHNDYTV